MCLLYLFKNFLTSNLFSTLLTAVVALFGFYYVQKTTRTNDAEKLLREEKRRVYLDFSTNCNVKKSFELYMKTLADLTQKNVATPEVRKLSAQTEVHFQLDTILDQLSLVSNLKVFEDLKKAIAYYEVVLLQYCITGVNSYLRNSEGKVTGASNEKINSDHLKKSNDAFNSVISLMRLDLSKV